MSLAVVSVLSAGCSCDMARLQAALKLSDRQQLELLEVSQLFQADKARLEAAQQDTLAKIHVRLPAALASACLLCPRSH